MKKILFTLAVAAFGFTALQAQCTPDTTITQTIVPPAGTKYDTVGSTPIAILPYGYTGQPYSEVMHFKVPQDTTVPGFGTIPINYVKLDSIIGLPAGFALSCSPSNCEFPGGSYGCVLMSGTPTVVDSVALQVAIEYNVTVSGLATPIKDTLGGYYFVTKGGGSVSLTETRVSNQAPRLYPNPASNAIFVKYQASTDDMVRLQLSNIIGQRVYDRTFKSTNGENKLEVNTSSLKPGIYLYRLEVGAKSHAGRFTISR